MTPPLPNAPGWWYCRATSSGQDAVFYHKIFLNDAGELRTATGCVDDENPCGQVNGPPVPGNWHGPFSTREEAAADAAGWVRNPEYDSAPLGVDLEAAVNPPRIELGGKEPPDWIPCDSPPSSLPDGGQPRVLVWDGDRHWTARFWPEDGKFHCYECLVIPATHWMPLPNPPKA